jgi:hypothetical protein
MAPDSRATIWRPWATLLLVILLNALATGAR